MESNRKEKKKGRPCSEKVEKLSLGDSQVPYALRYLPSLPSAFKWCHSLDEGNDTTLTIPFLKQNLTLFKLALRRPIFRAKATVIKEQIYDDKETEEDDVSL